MTNERLPIGAPHAVEVPAERMRFDRVELSGSLGDLGTFLPLLVGMVVQTGLSFPAALFFAGAFNMVTAVTFRIPMAVQPMKAIAAVALAGGLSADQIVAAGMCVSAVVLLLGVTGAIGLVQRWIPRSVVRGLQLALGLSLAMRGMGMAVQSGRWWGSDSMVLALVAGAVAIAFGSSRRVPAALLLFAGGLLAAAIGRPEVVRAIELHLWLPSFSPPEWSAFEPAFWRAALPQIPLTLLNSVIAVCALSGDLFPERAASPRKVSWSVGAMNLIAGLFGAMPMCHGAGGLAGQHRFGARTGGSILALGAAKMALAVLFGGSLIALCAAFPLSILGVMLVASGVELASAGRDTPTPRHMFVSLATAAACLGLNHFALGVGIGVAIELLSRWSERTERGTRP